MSVYVNLTDNPWSFMCLFLFVLFFFLVKRKFCSGLEKAWGLSALRMWIFARFEFDSAIYSNFCSFLVSFIYL